MNLTYYTIGQIMILVSYLIFWTSRTLKNKYYILLWHNISRVTAIISFFCMNHFDGVKNSAFVIVRNTLGQFLDRKNQTTKYIVFFIMLSILMLMYYFDFHGISTICIGMCGFVNLYGVLFCKEQGIRICGIIGSVFYTFFMGFTGNVVGVICELICITITLVSYLKYKYVHLNPKIVKICDASYEN